MKPVCKGEQVWAYWMGGDLGDKHSRKSKRYWKKFMHRARRRAVKVQSPAEVQAGFRSGATAPDFS